METENKIVPEKAENEVSFENIDLNGMYDPGTFLQPYKLFYHLSGTMPSKIIYSGIDREKLFSTILTQFPNIKCCSIKSERWNFKDKNCSFMTSLFPIQKNLWIYYPPYCDLELLYNNNTPVNSLENMKNIIVSHKEGPGDEKGNVYLLCYSTENGLFLTKFKLEQQNIDIEKQYNDDFSRIHENLCEKLNISKNKGIVLLHGKPGTGKTSYIRYLNSVVNKRMIYVQSEIADRIASPEFIPFIMNYSDSLIVIEDAEKVLLDRNKSENSAVSNILNMSDGLLSDCLNVQLLCSFNTDLSKIDKALLRKGRIIACYEFKELEAIKAQKLAHNLGKNITINRAMTLADIFHAESGDFDKKKINKIGFAYA